MGMSKEKFVELEDRISQMTDDELLRLEHLAHSELMARDPGLDDFLCRMQADEQHIHQPAKNNESLPF